MLQGLEVGASLRGSQRPREDRCAAQKAHEQDLSSNLSCDLGAISDVDAIMWGSCGADPALRVWIGMRKGR